MSPVIEQRFIDIYSFATRGFAAGSDPDVMEK
jgi:hypothetical protein